ncbi:EamA family transporter [Algoriphagus terrigena]|uniref:EamA family transporter n=1 Tax=Algoriphagus terrigena TaxID=344884 RepID=UPI00047AAD95|nr:DMT family transporter [Algoriphagus terrigena]
MLKNILMVLGGAISFGVLTSFVKLAYRQGYNAAEISFVQALIGAVVLWLVFFFSKKENATRKEIPYLLFTGVFIGISTYFYYLSVKYISASVAIVLLMQFTWISILLEWAVFKKKPSRSEFAITVLILIGTLLASGLTPSQDISLPIEGIGYVLLASMVYAAYIVSNSRIGKDVNWQNKSAWTMTGSAISILLVNAQTLVFDHHLGLELLEWGVFLAVFGTILPPVLFAIGIPKIGATTSSLLMTVELPMAVISAHFILDESLSTTQVVGIAIMLTSIVMMNLIKSKKRDLLPT